MPWESVAQARWGHSPAGKRALGKSGVKEFDKATPEGSLAGTKGSKSSSSAKGKSKTVSRGSTRVDTYESKR